MLRGDAQMCIPYLGAERVNRKFGCPENKVLLWRPSRLAPKAAPCY